MNGRLNCINGYFQLTQGIVNSMISNICTFIYIYSKYQLKPNECSSSCN